MSKFKVGDRVRVTDYNYLPDDNYKKDTIFTIMDTPEFDSPILDTVVDGWGDSSIGDSLYWHVQEKYLVRVPTKNVIGGEIL